MVVLLKTLDSNRVYTKVYIWLESSRYLITLKIIKSVRSEHYLLKWIQIGMKVKVKIGIQSSLISKQLNRLI